ncbi:putative disease resistance protein RGA4 isoform X2 [Papaver somniferum]|uniref:putative disease resistance protein RGA4 isoform X2 n=1 Tax=Papaver somniferum TaxID=3469 RepID=UPI000E703032|nr:putative disease resistance protein RGA4 isoform X2 [Papaver somniferum]
MAEVILTTGIVKAVVGILTKLAADEIVLLWNGEEELRMLIETLKTIDAATDTAEKLQVSDASVRLWLKRLKDIAYDIEDLAAEVSYETMRHRERGIGKKARDLFSSDKVSYAVVKKVQDINKRLNWVTKNNNYSKLPIETHTETSLQSFDRETSPRVPQSIEGREADKNEILRILITSGERSFISFDQHQQNDRFYKYIKELKNYIAGLFFSLLGIAGLFYRARSSVASSSAASSSSSSSSASNFQNNQYPENVSVVSIVGMGGVGKTTLAGLIYKDEAVESFNPKIWVCVAGDFVARTVLLQILKFIIPETNLNNSSALVTLENQVEQQLRGKKYLLVLDDMWNVRADEWEKLTRVLTVGVLAGSKVLITSREVQKSVNGGIPSYKLKQLEDEECWFIIKSKAFLDGGAQQTGGDMMRIGREIAKKCMGLPLAAQSLGSLMHSKNRKEWEMIRDNDIWNDKEKDQFNIIPILKLSYDDYPSELKQCFSYCSIFPKNWEISKVTLVQLWIAEGFLGTCKLEKGRSIEDFADKFFDRLVWSSFLDGVQRSTLDDIVTCKMHDLVHDLAKAVVGDQELTSLKVRDSMWFCCSGLVGAR